MPLVSNVFNTCSGASGGQSRSKETGALPYGQRQWRSSILCLGNNCIHSGTYNELGLGETAGGDAIGEAIAPIEDFIIASYPSHPRSMLEDNRQQIATAIHVYLTDPQFCEMAAQTFPGVMRSRASPYQVREWTKEILSIPSEQLSGACY